MRPSTGHSRLVDGRAFEIAEVVVAAGTARPCHEGEWDGALVLIARGEIELDCRHGGTGHFGRGDMLDLSRLSPRALRNSGSGPTVLVAIRRAVSARS